MSNKTTIIAPSLLSADFSDLYSAVKICEQGGAEYIHIDVMDNHFVPNLTIGPLVVRSLRQHTDRFLDVHLMVTNPEKLVEPFARAGADGITFHIEAADNPDEVIDLIRAAGKQVGISIKPKTPIDEIEPYLEKVDMILIMSVEPGFGGQGYLTGSTERVMQIKQRLVELCLQDRVLIQVDGGIKLSNAKEVSDAGADILVAGSAVYGTENPIESIQKFLEITH